MAKSLKALVAGAAALLSLLGVSGPAGAALSLTSPVCTAAITNFDPDPSSCGGSFAGNNQNQQTDVMNFIAATWGLTGVTDAGSSDSTSFGPFTSNPDGTTGTLTFDTAQDGPFVLALKAGNSFSLFYFDGEGDAISSIAYTTAGSGTNDRNVNVINGLSHATLYTATAPIPEPETYALMLAGLGAVGLMARRRKSAAATPKAV